MKNYFNRQYDKIKSSLDLNVKRVLKSNQFILGREVNLLESKLEKLTKTKEVVTVSSGTDALIVGIKSLDLKNGDEIITTSNTWISSAYAIELNNCKPIFIDVDKYDFQMDINLFKKKNKQKN